MGALSLLCLCLICSIWYDQAGAERRKEDNQKIVSGCESDAQMVYRSQEQIESHDQGQQEDTDEPTTTPAPVIVIDAGHGGVDEGGCSYDLSVKEKDITLQVVQYLREYLEETDWEIHYTRLEDQTLSKPDRVKMANDLQADMLVSVHCNVSDHGDRQAQGIETLYSKRKATDGGLLTSYQLSQILLKKLCQETDRQKRRSIWRKDLYLMNHAKMPVSIVEIGYMSNRSDLRYISKPSHQKQIAKGIYAGICQVVQSTTEGGNTDKQ